MELVGKYRTSTCLVLAKERLRVLPIVSDYQTGCTAAPTVRLGRRWLRVIGWSGGRVVTGKVAWVPTTTNALLRVLVGYRGAPPTSVVVGRPVSHDEYRWLAVG